MVEIYTAEERNKVMKKDYEKIKAIFQKYLRGEEITDSDIERYWLAKHSYFLFKSLGAEPNSKEERRLYRKRMSGENFLLNQLKDLEQTLNIF